MHSKAFPATMPDLPQGVVVPADLSESDDYNLQAALTHRFGWAYAVWQPAVVNPASAGLYRLDGDTLIYAPAAYGDLRYLPLAGPRLVRRTRLDQPQGHRRGPVRRSRRRRCIAAVGSHR